MPSARQGLQGKRGAAQATPFDSMSEVFETPVAANLMSVGGMGGAGRRELADSNQFFTQARARERLAQHCRSAEFIALCDILIVERAGDDESWHGVARLTRT